VLGVAKTPIKKGTTVTNKYQKNMPKTSTGPGLAVPGAVTISMSEIAEDMREGDLEQVGPAVLAAARAFAARG